jgi:hypothetical protein
MSQISNYTEEDSASAMRKLEEAAFRWDHTNYIESVFVSGFEAYLTPYDFKQQIERSFRVHLTGAEVSTVRLGLTLLGYKLILRAFALLRVSHRLAHC